VLPARGGHDGRLDPLDALGNIDDPCRFGGRDDDPVGIGAYQVAGPDLDPGDSDRLTDGD
jgi:hypothetical protein